MLLRDITGSKKMLPGTTSPMVYDSTYVGVEVETEGCNISITEASNGLRYWNVTLDGSLKSAFPFEFVFLQPLSGRDIVAALEELEQMLKVTPVKYPLNTGVHVHINVGDLTLRQLRRFVYLLIVTESALIQYSGGKFNNSFCVPWKNASNSTMKALGLFLEGEQHHVCTEGMKYSTINVASVFDKGSVEVRTMKGTHSKDEILDWINILLKLKDIAVNHLHNDEVWDYTTSPDDVIKFLLKIWDEDIVRKMLHPSLHEDMLASSLIARVTLFPKSINEFYQAFNIKQKTKKHNIIRDDLEELLSPSTASHLTDWATFTVTSSDTTGDPF